MEFAGDIGAHTPESPGSGGLRLDCRNTTDVLGLLRMPGIVSALHPGPNPRAVTKQLAEANRRCRGHRLSFPKDVVERLTRNPEQAGDFRLGPAGGGDNVVAKQRAGMRRATLLA